MRHVNSIRIGLHAPRNAGKTCLFACLYGLRHLLPEQVSFDDEATLAHLRRAWEFIRKGQVPPATAMTRPSDIAWRITAGEEKWDIQSRDYPGALVEPSTDGTTRELRTEARKWFRSCDAILILVDSSAPDVEQLDVVDLLLAELRKEGADGRTVARPLALVLTKWDTQGPVTPDAEEEAERLQQYFATHRVFERLQQTLKDAAGQVEVFPVSAFGTPGPGPGLVPPVEAMKPYHLLEPWKWAARRSQQIAGLRARQARRRRWRRRLLAAALLAAALAGTYGYADRRAAREFLELRDFRAANGDDPRAAERVARNEQFLQAWWSRAAPPQREVVRDWRDADRERAESHRREVERVERQGRHDAAYRRLLAEGPRLERAADDAGLYDLYAKFIDEFPESPFAESFKPKRDRARAAWDRRAWDELLDYEKRHGETGNVQNLLSRLRDYLKVPQAANRADALRKMAGYEEQWDREEYGELLKQAGRGVGGENLERLRARVVEYIDSPRDIKVMTAAAAAWKSWFDGLQVERPYTVRVKTVTIPRRSELDSFWGVDLRVTVELGDQSQRTGTREGRFATFNEDLGPFRFRWGDPKRLTVRVENHFALLSNDGAEATVDDDRFVLGRCHGPVQVTCRKGKTITVELECPAAVPPALPPYGGQ